MGRFAVLFLFFRFFGHALPRSVTAGPPICRSRSPTQKRKKFVSVINRGSV
jgi:hypothetical protein